MNRIPASSHRACHLDSLSFPVPEVLAPFPELPSICSPPASFHHFSLFRGSALKYLSRDVLNIATTLSNVLECRAQVRKLDSTLLFLPPLCFLFLLFSSSLWCSIHRSLGWSSRLLSTRFSNSAPNLLTGNNQQSSQLLCQPVYPSVKWGCYLLILV